MFPRYAPSFGTFQHSYSLLPGVRAFMPPQGLLVMAAYLPKQWEVRFIDENLHEATDADFRWADAVFISGMHVQRGSISRINRRAQANGALTVLGGPSVSACQEYYPEVDLLHVGEIGDGTDAMIDYLDRSCEKPPSQMIFQTNDRLPLESFPVPAYHLIDLRKYFLGSVQFSSGCPYMCEFCDIPGLYGRNPRLKTPEQVIRELDAIVAHGCRSAVYFVDDNFVANRNAAKELLPHLVRWQHDRGYPLDFACEATLNIAQSPDLLDQMREAMFRTVFCGIETPEPEALRAMHKKQNLRTPILDAVKAMNERGMEVVSGIILGLDTDTPDTPDRILDFIEESRIPMLTINLLYALPKTPLHDRLTAEGRVLEETPAGRESNVVFRMPYNEVRAMWLRCISEAYEPGRLFDRFADQCEMTYVNRLQPRRKVSASTVAFGLRAIGRVLWRCGVRNDTRHEFWHVVKPLLRAKRIEELMHIGVVSHHLIRFTRDCCESDGWSEACFYADPSKARTAELAGAR